ncbi:uncharacterized protein LOC121404026 [Drosophila obscura]|uniref:uncharacterized protein LOC121404026 n=1 Tax=Drosophila obscura TaxID=7282 RepID=UPI001BB24345|nr:uncharacterized protein LOC121404026 [Drosophila obscura]
MNEAEERLLSLLTGKLNSMAGEIQNLTQRVQFLESRLGETQNLTKKVEDLEAQLLLKLDAQAKANVACDLRIHGVPYVEGEKLKHIFNNLCLSLNHTPAPAIRDIYRMRPNKNLSHSIVDPIIIVKLERVRDKAALLRNIAPVYVNEQLTRENYQIFREALKMKKHRKLQSVFTRRGMVHVKVTQESEIWEVLKIEDLWEMQAATESPAAGDENSSFRQ